MFLGLVALLGGCGGGGGGSSTATIITNARVNAISVDPDPAGTVIHYSLVSPESHSMSITVWYSEDRGVTYRPATVSGSVAALAATPEGRSHEITWRPMEDLESSHQADLRVRVVPTDEITGGQGTAARSDVFALGPNLPPTIAAVTTPTATVGGEIEFFYSVVDPEADVVGIELQYSLNGGASWFVATPGTVGDGTSAVTTSATGEIRSVSWFAQADAPDTISNATLFRITPVDVATGVPGQTLAFSVNLVAPVLELITLEEVPESMNGSQPLGGGNGTFNLNVPRFGFAVNLVYESQPSGAPVDPDTLLVTSNQAIGTLPPGSDLGSLFDAAGDTATWSVGEGHALALGVHTFSASVRDDFGNVSNVEQLPLRAVAVTGVELPFEFADVWLLDFGTDLFTTTFTTGSVMEVTSTVGANGVSDFREDLTILGLRSSNPTAECAALGTNGILFSWVREETLGRVRELFGGSFDGSSQNYSANIDFTLGSGSVTSAIRIGGGDGSPGFTLGRAAFDYRNATANDNRTVNLGVFTTNLIAFYVNNDPTFRGRFDDLIPGRGVPAGEHALDATVLDPDFDRFDSGNTVLENIRYDEIYSAIDAIARVSAVIASHEIGHSVGLVANGHPPQGLFGGVHDAPFADAFTNDFHLDTAGFNLMAAALSFAGSLITGSSGYRFNELNRAYLSESTVLGD